MAANWKKTEKEHGCKTEKEHGCKQKKQKKNMAAKQKKAVHIIQYHLIFYSQRIKEQNRKRDSSIGRAKTKSHTKCSPRKDMAANW